MAARAREPEENGAAGVVKVGVVLGPVGGSGFPYLGQTVFFKEAVVRGATHHVRHLGEIEHAITRSDGWEQDRLRWTLPG